jgi:hypothetical protein
MTATFIHGLDSAGNLVPIKVESDGKLIISGDITIGDVTVSDVEISNDTGNPVPVSGPLTDTQLRATPVPVSGTVAISNSSVEISNDVGNAVPISGTVTATTAAGSIVGSATTVVGVELTRPADTTAYTAKDVVSDSTSAPTVLTFANFARVNAGSGIIVRARLMTDQKTNTAQFRLHLFHTAPTATNDNSPYLLLYSNAANRIGMIDFPAMTSEDSTNSTAAATMRPSSDGGFGPPNLWYQAAAASRAIYGVLEAVTAFTPASGQKFYIELAAVND